MNRSEEHFVEQLRGALDANAQKVDTSTLDRLAQIRRQAMSRRAVESSFIPRFAPAIAFAASAIMLAIMLRVPDGSIPELDANAMLFEVVLASNDLELIEDLEFYSWLDANGNAG